MPPFYTAAGDSGETGYLGEGRISKSSLRIEGVGSVDEANATIGLARAFSEGERTRSILLDVQKHLYYLMSELSASPEAAERFDKITDEHVHWLEAQVADIEDSVKLPKEFIIPGNTPASGALALARTIVRRAERQTVALLERKLISKALLVAYLNRLSSLLFVLEVYETSISGHPLQLTKED